jgi:O-antigen chain-terminating methyltransferase
VFEKSYKKLKSGAYLIAETPNPTMLSTFTNAFYIDPSHIKPIHPETMKFLLQYYGFKEINIKYCEESKINYQLPLLIGDQHIKNLKEFNDGINLLSSILFGYQDYAIIGKK